MRFDSVGMFWQEAPQSGKRGIPRHLAPIPPSDWKPPSEFPNLSAAKYLSIDTETYDPELEDHGPGWSRDPGKFNIVGFSVGVPEGQSWYFPIRHTIQTELNLNPDHALAWARDTLRDPNQPKVGASLLYDVGGFRHEGIEVRGDLYDVQFGEALLEERSHVDLDFLAEKYLGRGKEHQKPMIEWLARSYGGRSTTDSQKKNIYRCPPSLVGPYGEDDAKDPILVLPHIWKRLEEENLTWLFRMECDLIPLLVEMRYRGVRVDVAKAEQLRDQLAWRIANEQRKLKELVGLEVNVYESDSLARAFNKMGVAYPYTAPTKAHPRGQPSITKPWLEKLNHPLGNLIKEIKRLKKIRDVFIESYILGGQVNGIVHGSFHPLRGEDRGTIIGRFSSSNPNLQNLPIRDKVVLADGTVETLGIETRNLFIPFEGHAQWRKLDLSQIQYRLLVHYACGPGAEEARNKYRSDPKTDYHNWTLELVQAVFGNKLDRRPVKNINFGLSFGMGIDKLITDLMTFGHFLATRPAAEHFLDMYHKGVRFLKPTVKSITQEAEKTGFITSLLNRRARFDLWVPATYEEHESPPLPLATAIQRYGRVKRAYSHKALNRLLQMGEADFMKAALWKCWKDGVFSITGVPTLTVHDENDFSDPGTKEAAQGFEHIREVMAKVIPISIPVFCEEKIGSRWGECD
jgi:DNA polymerase-1